MDTNITPATMGFLNSSFTTVNLHFQCKSLSFLLPVQNAFNLFKYHILLEHDKQITTSSQNNNYNRPTCKLTHITYKLYVQTDTHTKQY